MPGSCALYDPDGGVRGHEEPALCSAQLSVLQKWLEATGANFSLHSMKI